MRITAEEKTATRQRILDAAVQLFRKRGFEPTTTRDIADGGRNRHRHALQLLRHQGGDRRRSWPRRRWPRHVPRFNGETYRRRAGRSSCSPTSRPSCGTSSRCANSSRRCWRRRSRRSRPRRDANRTIPCGPTTWRPSPSSLANTDSRSSRRSPCKFTGPCTSACWHSGPATNRPNKKTPSLCSTSRSRCLSPGCAASGLETPK